MATAADQLSFRPARELTPFNIPGGKAIVEIWSTRLHYGHLGVKIPARQDERGGPGVGRGRICRTAGTAYTPAPPPHSLTTRPPSPLRSRPLRCSGVLNCSDTPTSYSWSRRSKPRRCPPDSRSFEVRFVYSLKHASLGYVEYQAK